MKPTFNGVSTPGIKTIGLVILGFIFGIFALSMFQTPLYHSPENNIVFANPQAGGGDFGKKFEDAAAQFLPLVVSILSERVVKATDYARGGSPFPDEFFRRFFGAPPQGQQKEQRERGLGSGVIISSDGYIVTNNHVVDGADQITVGIQNEKQYKAKVVGIDPPTDLAVLKIDAENLQFARWGDSEQIKIGQWVIAIGNPFQLMQTVTAGIISAKGRTHVLGGAGYEDFIQTDAAINPGNSGGALITLDGELIGINSAIYSESGGYMGIGFAIPSKMGKNISAALISEGKVSRGYLGLGGSDIDENLAKAFKLKGTKGVLVNQIEKGSPAEEAGIREGDVIIDLNGTEVQDYNELRNRVATLSPKTRIPVTIIRDGKQMTMDVTLVERPAEETAKTGREEAPEEATTKLGFQVTDLTPELAQQLGYDGQKGIVVTNVENNSAARDAGLMERDLIIEVDKKPIGSASELMRYLSKTKNDVVLLRVRNNREDGSAFYRFIAVPIKK